MMIRTRISLTALLALGLVATSALGAAAQESAPNSYFTAQVTGEPANVVEPPDYELDFGRGIDGVELSGLPFEASDPRISGLLSAVHNGRGGPITEGFSRLEARSLRIENENGAWAGPAYDFFAAGEEELLAGSMTAWLVGEGDYEGLHAYLVDNAEYGGEMRGTIFSVEQVPLPDPVPAQ